MLKDVPEAPLEMLRRPDQDSTRLALYPSLDYTGLYRALVQLFDIVPLLQYGVHGERGAWGDLLTTRRLGKVTAARRNC